MFWSLGAVASDLPPITADIDGSTRNMILGVCLRRFTMEVPKLAELTDIDIFSPFCQVFIAYVSSIQYNNSTRQNSNSPYERCHNVYKLTPSTSTTLRQYNTIVAQDKTLQRLRK